MPASPSLSRVAVVRLGLVQAGMSSVIVLLTSTLNRVMVIELGLAAAVPGLLLGLYFSAQFLVRPRIGHRIDRGHRRTPTIIAAMALLGLMAPAAAAATALVETDPTAGRLALAASFMLIGVGVSGTGTSVMSLRAERVPPHRRATSAAIVWLLLISGGVASTLSLGALLRPFSMAQLIRASAGLGLAAFTLSALAILGVEGTRGPTGSPARAASFPAAVRLVWHDPVTRRFAVFVLVAMLGFSAQDLILEPFAGVAFGLDPAASTRISSLHQIGMLLGMILAGLVAVRYGGLSAWAAGGCLVSGAAFLGLVLSADNLPLFRLCLLTLGVANGCFAVGAVGGCMIRARGDHAGLQMGVFGAAQAVAYGLGGFLGAAGSDVGNALLGSRIAGYTSVFLVEAVLFGGAAVLAWNSRAAEREEVNLRAGEEGDAMLAGMG